MLLGSPCHKHPFGHVLNELVTHHSGPYFSCLCYAGRQTWRTTKCCPKFSCSMVTIDISNSVIFWQDSDNAWSRMTTRIVAFNFWRLTKSLARLIVGAGCASKREKPHMDSHDACENPVRYRNDATMQIFSHVHACGCVIHEWFSLRTSPNPKCQP